jgi:hypothetical protein
VDAEPAGTITIENMVKVEEAREESRRDPRYRYCFQLDTIGARNYMLCAENMDTMREWMRVLQMNIDALPPAARVCLVCLCLSVCLSVEGEGGVRVCLPMFVCDCMHDCASA